MIKIRVVALTPQAEKDLAWALQQEKPFAAFKSLGYEPEPRHDPRTLH